jgi:VWFA-related protein
MISLLCLALLGQAPQFKSGVERILVDVQVIDNQGRPVPALRPEDFEVRVDQQRRTVASAEFIRAAATDTPAGGAMLPNGAPAPPASDAASPGGRDFILAIDESSFLTRYAPAAVRAARGFVERLAPADRVGLYRYPVSKQSFSLTPDHGAVLKELDRVVGTLDPPISQYHLSKSEVIDIEAGDPDAISRVLARECPPRDRACSEILIAEAHSLAAIFEGQVAQSMGGLRTLFNALRQDPTRKTVVIVSGGLLASDRIGARPDVSGIIGTVGEAAARAGATIYVLHLDSSFLEAFSAANGNGVRTSLLRDQSASAGGLERLAGTAGGTLLRIEPGSEDRAFQRILRETSAYYLLGVEPLDRDRDGRTHFISVKVKVHGAEVRARSSVVVPKPQGGSEDLIYERTSRYFNAPPVLNSTIVSDGLITPR